MIYETSVLQTLTNYSGLAIAGTIHTNDGSIHRHGQNLLRTRDKVWSTVSGLEYYEATVSVELAVRFVAMLLIRQHYLGYPADYIWKQATDRLDYFTFNIHVIQLSALERRRRSYNDIRRSA